MIVVLHLEIYLEVETKTLVQLSELSIKEADGGLSYIGSILRSSLIAICK